MADSAPPTNFFYMHRKTPVAVYRRQQQFIEAKLSAGNPAASADFRSNAAQVASREWQCLTRAVRTTPAPQISALDAVAMRAGAVRLELDQLEAIPFDTMLSVQSFTGVLKHSSMRDATSLGSTLLQGTADGNIVDALGLTALSTTAAQPTQFSFTDLYLALTDSLVLTPGEHDERFDSVWIRHDSNLFHALFERRREPIFRADLRHMAYAAAESGEIWFVGCHLAQFFAIVGALSDHAEKVHAEARGRVF